MQVSHAKHCRASKIVSARFRLDGILDEHDGQTVVIPAYFGKELIFV